MNSLFAELAPWELSFSYARALQQTPLQIWAGQAQNAARAQQAFYKRAKLNGLARRGDYRPEMEKND